MNNLNPWGKVAYLVLGAFIIVWLIGATRGAYELGTGLSFNKELEWRQISHQEWVEVIHTDTGRQIQRNAYAKGRKYAILMGVSFLGLGALLMVAVHFAFLGGFFTRWRTLFVSFGIATLGGLFNAMAQAVPFNRSEPQVEALVGMSLLYFVIFYATVGLLVVIRRIGEKFFGVEPIKTPVPATGIDDSNVPRLRARIGEWWRATSPRFRLWIFASAIWTIGVPIFVAIFDPYNSGRWGLDDEQFLQIATIVMLPWIFGLLKSVYGRYVR